MELTCERCGETFEKTNKRGPKPKYCGDACKQANHRSEKPAKKVTKKVTKKATKAKKAVTKVAPREGLTLRDVVNVAELELSVKQCDVVINAFTKARLRAAKRDRDAKDDGF